MTEPTQNEAEAVGQREELLGLLAETGRRIDSAREELDQLREYRGQLLLLGKDAGITTARLARAVGMRREQAHYAITRARADGLTRELEEVRG